MKKIVVIFLFLGLLIRFWNFQSMWGFDYDQEINARIAKSIVVDHKPILIGPETSVGAMYVGPYFNYVIALFFALGKMDPMGTVALNILLSVATLTIFYLVGKDLFGWKTALIGLVIYAFSFMIIGYDQTLWNPTPIPLVSLLFFYFLSKNRVLLSAIFLGLMFHLHFQAVLLAVIFGIYLLLFNRKGVFNLKNIIGIVLIVFIFFTPLVIFDIRHDFLNSSHLIKFFFGTSGTSKTIDFYQILQTASILLSSLRDIIYNGSFEIVRLITLFLPLVTFFHIIRNFKNNFFKVFLVAIFVAFLAFSLYKGPPPTQYYFLFLYPLFILSFSHWLSQRKMALVTALLLVFSVLNLIPLLTIQNNLSLQNKHSAVKFVSQKADGKSFKVDMVTWAGLNTGYKYLFWLEGKNPSYDYTAVTEKSFKMVIPATIARKGELNATFGAIGVVELQ